MITFLHILLDTATMELRLPHDKLEALTSLLRQWNTTKKKTTKRELLSLIGKLSFAAKVIPAGRIFLRRLIDLSTLVKKPVPGQTSSGGKISFQDGMESV